VTFPKLQDTGIAIALKASLAFIASMWAGWGFAIQIMVILMGFDMLTGVLKALIAGKVSSSTSIRGLEKKIAIGCAILFVHILDEFLPYILAGIFGVDATKIPHLGIEKMFALYVAFNESISIIENLNQCGVDFPAPLIRGLAKLKERMPKGATQADMDSLGSDSSKLTVSSSIEIVKTPASSPDLEVTKTATLLEERHVKPVDTQNQQP
jgi:toxin secretion/phage lysis holin